MMAWNGVSAILLLGLLATAAMIYPAVASDPDLTTDVGINNPVVSNFTFTGFRNPIPLGQGSAMPMAATFNMGLPGLSGLGLTPVLFEFGPISQIDPHTHPRATEVFYVTSGSLEVGFVDTSNTLFETTLETGDVFVFPKGLLHFQRNNCNATASGYSVLSSQNPGTLLVATALFDSTNGALPNNVLATAFKTSEQTIQTIKNGLA